MYPYEVSSDNLNGIQNCKKHSGEFRIGGKRTASTCHELSQLLNLGPVAVDV